MKLYCSCCDNVQPVFIGECKDAKTNELYQDIVCAECFLVIASGTGIKQIQQVDLSDDEIADAIGSPLDEVYLADFRAVIAAYKEKNK